MKNFFFLFVACFACALSISAHDFEVNGIYYNKLGGDSVAVTYRGSVYNDYNNEYSGSITIPETVSYNGTTYRVTSIGEYAFFDCGSLTAITIPNSVTSIGRSAFYRCSSLTATIPNSVTTIGVSAFYKCSSLTDITIPNSVTTIGGDAFNGCSGLTEVTIGESVTSIGSFAFRTCTDLTKITWNAKHCTGAPFYDISSQITSFTFGEQVEYIPEDLCYGMSKLTAVTIPNSVTTIGNNAFEYCSSLQYNTHDNAKYLGNSENPYHALIQKTSSSITSCAINENTKVIAGSAFQDCTSLTAITIPNSITTIGADAFSGCSSLTSVSWNAKSCSDCTGCPFPATQIAIMNFGESVEHIPAYLCKGMDKLLSLKLPDTIETIGNNVFDGCTSLKRLTLGNSITSIGNYAFANCTNLPEIALPQSVETIGDYAFSGDVAFTTMLIPDAVTTIGSYAYKGCTSLNTVTIGKAVTTINNNAFDGCTALQTIAIPDNVTTLGANAFVSCTSLQSVTIGNGLSQVSEKTFSGCSTLQTVEIGKSIASFGTGAFYDCKALQTVSINTATPPAVTYYNNKTSSNYAFYGVPTIAEFLIPCAAAEEYEYSPYWQGLNVVVSIPPTLIVQASDMNHGTVSITKEHSCEDATATIEAQANVGYHFVVWNDGVTTNPRTITVTEDMTYTATFAQDIAVLSITLNTNTLALTGGETAQLIATIVPENATYQTITWTSSKPEVATVKNGTVTAIDDGQTIITATSADGKVSAQCEVNVTIPLESISLPSNMTLAVGESTQLTATFSPTNATNKNITWLSSTQTVVSVEDGKITALAVGSSTITAISEDGNFVATCQVSVKIPVASLTLNESNLTLGINETYQLIPSILPEDATNQTVSWESDNADVVSVSSTGLLTATGAGSATITAEVDGQTTTCSVTVIVPVQSITLNETNLRMKVGETFQLVATVLPENATDATVTWGNTAPNIVFLNKGMVVAVGLGTAVVTAQTPDGKIASCVVNVVVPTSGVQLDRQTLTLTEGDVVQLTATVQPADATNQAVTWESDDTDVAMVVDGKVTALAAGEATITVTTTDGGFTDVCTVTVQPRTIAVTGLELSETSVTLAVGDEYKITATVMPENATNRGVKWMSGTPSVVSVENGLLKALAIGTSTVIVMTEEGNFMQLCQVTVGNGGTLTELEHVDASTNSVQKVLEDGTIYILRNGEKYTIDGRKVE